MNAWQRFITWLSPSTTNDALALGATAPGTYLGSDPYTDFNAMYRLPAGHGDVDAPVGGGWAEQTQARRNISTIGGGDVAWYNPGLGCFRAMHYGERQLPGRRYLAYIPVLGFSEWLR